VSNDDFEISPARDGEEGRRLLNALECQRRFALHEKGACAAIAKAMGARG